MVKAIVGANWGDEGKGKITDMLAEQSDVVITIVPADKEIKELYLDAYYGREPQDYAVC